MTVELYCGDCLNTHTFTDIHKERISHSLKKGQYFSCLVCGNNFWRKPSAIKKGDCKFCSLNCYYEWQRGRERSQEFKDKCKNKDGEKNPNWRGGITAENKRIRNSQEFISWRNAVFDRDNFTCRKCGAKSTKGKYTRIEAHHILPFASHPESRFDIENGITLCKKCHSKEPKGKEIWQMLR